MASLEAGAIFARRYRIVRLVAAGGMGAVYEVEHVETDRRLALKVMHPHVLPCDDLRERFKREARIAARVSSEYIVDVFDAGVDDATAMPFLVMELLQGEELGARLARLGRLAPREVVAHLSQAAIALDRTHRASIVHRDLKPRNLFLEEREDGATRIKVLDFGIAKIVAEGATTCGTQVVGTPLYMAPEQLDANARLTGAVDVYALGMVAYTLLVGAAYFDEEARARGVLALATVIARGPVEPARARAAARGVTLPESFDVWFARATARRAEDRFATAVEAARALAEALDVEPMVREDASLPSAPALSASHAEPPAVARRGIRASVGAAVLVLLMLGFSALLAGGARVMSERAPSAAAATADIAAPVAPDVDASAVEVPAAEAPSRIDAGIAEPPAAPARSEPVRAAPAPSSPRGAPRLPPGALWKRD